MLPYGPAGPSLHTLGFLIGQLIAREVPSTHGNHLQRIESLEMVVESSDKNKFSYFFYTHNCRITWIVNCYHASLQAIIAIARTSPWVLIGQLTETVYCCERSDGAEFVLAERTRTSFYMYVWQLSTTHKILKNDRRDCNI